MPRYRLKISGRVQGVSYRYSTKKRALELSLTGWVKNEPDGTVSVEIEGKEANLQAMIDWCWSGPSFAKVDDIQVEEAAEKGYTSFEIIR